MTDHAVVSRDEWVEARRELLQKEKEVTRRNDELSRQRRELPWVEVDKHYLFDGPDGKQTLAGLFDGRSQLIVYHFMFGPGWEEGCDGCSFVADHIDGANLHLAHHDVSVVAVSRAPLSEFQAFKQRMDWNFTWVSSYGSDFNSDYQVSVTKDDLIQGKTFLYNYKPYEPEGEGENHGLSVFYRDESGTVFHTYSTYARGVDILLGAHHYLDLTPKGRNEASTMDWVRLHDKYGDNGSVDPL
jgi:predicted dithiol-disulfide oxidoreductase (DUF899 family)